MTLRTGFPVVGDTVTLDDGFRWEVVGLSGQDVGFTGPLFTVVKLRRLVGAGLDQWYTYHRYLKWDPQEWTRESSGWQPRRPVVLPQVGEHIQRDGRRYRIKEVSEFTHAQYEERSAEVTPEVTWLYSLTVPTRKLLRVADGVWEVSKGTTILFGMSMIQKVTEPASA